MSRDYIFLSYSHKDIQKIQKTIDWMESHYNVWYDKNLGLAREYNEEIADQIRNAKIVIAFFSASYMESPYCRDEIMYARTKGIEILGIIIGDVQMSEGMQLRLGRFQMLNFTGSTEYEKITLNSNVQKCSKDSGKESLLENLQHSQEEMKAKQLPRMLFATDFDSKKAFSLNQKWEKSNAGSLRVPIGLRQDSDNNEIAEAYYDTDYGHQCVYGNSMSGKSILLQTIAIQLMDNYSPDAVQFYMIDYGNYMLEIFKHAPHVGDVMNRDETDKIDRFFIYMERELRDRIRFFRNGSYSTYAQKYGVEKPFVIIMIDGFESFGNEYLTSDDKETTFKAILREGMRAGILFLLGNGSTRRTVYGLSMENVRPLAALGYESFERYDQVFGEYVNTREISKKDTFESPGRGMIKAGRKVFLLQSALPVDVAEDYDRYDALAEKCKKMRSAWEGKCAQKVPTVPEVFTSDDFLNMPEVQSLGESNRHLSIGLNLNTACPEAISLENNYIFPIIGKNGVEKSNLIKLFMKQIALKNWNCTLIDPKMAHKSMADELEIQHVSNTLELYDVCRGLIEEIKDRYDKKKELTKGSILDYFKPRFIVIDGLTEFYNLLNQEFSKEKNIGSFLHNIMGRGMNCGVYFIISADSDRKGYEFQEPIAGMTKMIRENCNQGMFFGGNILDDRWFELDFQSGKKFAYDIGLTHGKGAALLVSKAGVGNNDIVKVPLVTC